MVAKRNKKCDNVDLMTEDTRVGAQRPGGRAARVRSVVLKTTAEMLAEVGYDEMSVEEVATRAGVHKTTVYRRWSTKSALIADAIRVSSQENVPIPDTGSLRGDLQALARSVAATIGSTDGARRSRSLAAAGTMSEELAADMHAFWAERLSASGTVIDRAIARGELPASCDPNLIIETLIGPLWVRLLLTGEPITADLADRVADLVTDGATLWQQPQ